MNHLKENLLSSLGSIWPMEFVFSAWFGQLRLLILKHLIRTINLFIFFILFMRLVQCILDRVLHVSSQLPSPQMVIRIMQQQKGQDRTAELTVEVAEQSLSREDLYHWPSLYCSTSPRLKMTKRCMERLNIQMENFQIIYEK